jgi:hypothetical protein
MPKLSKVVRTTAAQHSLAAWAQLIFGAEFEQPAHVRQIIEALERVERGEIKRLLICMPPRFGKSWLTSVAFLSWYREPVRQAKHGR